MSILYDIHTIKHNDNYLVFDIPSVTLIKTDKALGEYIKAKKNDLLDKKSEKYDSLISKFQKAGVLLEDNDVQYPHNNNIFKLSLEVFTGCNMRCLYCYAHINTEKQTKVKPSFSNIKKAIDYFIFDFGKHASSYEINIVGGGEPLLNFDLIKRTKEYCKEIEAKINKRIVFWIFTNGTVFNKKILEYLIISKQGITISLDGPKDIQNYLRPLANRKESHTKIKYWINYIKNKSKGKGGIENLWVSTVVTAKHTSIIEILNHLNDLGITKAQIRPIRTEDPDLSFNNGKLSLLRNLYKEMVYSLIKEARLGNFEKLKIILNHRDYWGRHVINLITKTKFQYRCDAAKTMLCVKANGKIYPCDIAIDIPEFRTSDLGRFKMIPTCSLRLDLSQEI